MKGCIFVKGHVINWNKLNDPKWKEYFNRFMKIYYMETVFKLNAKELDMSFIDSIRNLFKDHDIEISIKQVEDETEYLLKSPENKKNILEAITDVKKNKNLIRFTAQEFEELTEKLMNS